MRAPALALLLAGCGAGSAPDAGPAHEPGAALTACAALQSRGPVGTVAAAVQRLNALPQPATVPCFVASLPRPLLVVATTSVTSAQPASPGSPRLFILQPGLAVSVVGEGDGAPLVEFGQWMSATRTVKGEVALPFEAPLAPDAPLTRVVSPGGGTGCGLCHRGEAAEPSVEGGFASVAFRPAAASEVPFPTLEVQHRACVATGEVSGRCELLHAVFDLGEAAQGAFAPAVERFLP